MVEGTRRFGFMWLASAVRAAVGGVVESKRFSYSKSRGRHGKRGLRGQR